MTSGVYIWSQTAANNATADSTVNWAEGMPPSAVNDSGRAMMADIAKYRDDTSGKGHATGGTSTAYTLTSYQVFDIIANMVGMEISAIVHATNGASPTLNVDGLGAFPIVTASGVAVSVGTLIANSIYTLVFNTTEWLLKDFYSNPYNIPVGGGMDYWGTTVPNSNFAFPIGQAISRTTYAALFALVGTTYGVGDGSTTFNLPDKTGRVSAMKEASASRLTSTYFGGNSANMGAVGGLESHTLTTAQLATHNHTITDSGHTHTSGPSNMWVGSVNGATQGGAQSTPVSTQAMNGISTGSSTTGISLANAGSGNAHNNVQPTIVCNYIIRIL